MTLSAQSSLSRVAGSAPTWRRALTTPRARLAFAIALLVGIHGLRVLVGPQTGTGISFLLVLPVVLVASERGVWAGIASGTAAYLVFLLWTLDGQVTGVGAVGHAVRAGVFLLVGAVTGAAAERLQAAVDRQRHLADSLGDMVSAHDPEGRYLYASSASIELLGYRPDELVGRSAYDFFHPHDVRLVRTAHDRSLEVPDVATTVYRARRADGRYAWLETVARPIREDGEVVEILCSSRDVTARETERLAREDDHDALRAQVEQVLAERSIEPVLQPIVRLGTREVIGYEALARFPLVASRPPDVWFRHAADVGLGEELELLAIERALEAFDAIPATVSLCVNASPETLCSPRLMDVVRDAPPDRLIIELTEHDEIADYPGFNVAVQGLRSRGIRLAVDDAGAGFASLRHILDVRPEIIKLDMTLTRHIHRDVARRALASALADFAISLGSDVIAEGIESQEELDELLGLGITLGQGYLLGRPALFAT